MNLIVLDMPDDPTLLAGWLERQVVGMRLAELVAELSAVYPRGEQMLTLDEVLGLDREAAISRGLGAVPLGTVGRLLRHPHVLIDLQEQVLLEGGRHWQTVPLAGEHRASIEEQGKALLQAVQASAVPRKEPRRGHLKTWLRILSVSTAAAAAVLVALVLWPKTPTSDWGWARPGALAADLPAAQYMNRLADEANQWFDARPSTSAALLSRLGEMRRGCDLLLAAPRKPLAEADRAWLQQKCRDWASKFDVQIAQLQAGAAVDSVRQQADDTVRSMCDAIKQRAAQLS